ncbi:VC2046/SO_2500 family protein [Echinimonas agarilytica]|uniref:Ribosomal S4P n=1 Tax=Echinimonas agarilytica TaxID=1215918 RepID=A0AA41W948_9GAMM|nr:hypothetical protein [Echinimonas agarilytica]
MTIQATQPLRDEWQLGTQLNDCAHGGDSDKFRLLLAMLSEDVRDQAQFHQLETQHPLPSSLREQFDLPPEQALYSAPEALLSTDKADAMNNGGMSAVHLLNCLNPDALCGPEQSRINADVLATMSPLRQAQVQGSEPETKQPANWQAADQALLAMLNQSRQHVA